MSKTCGMTIEAMLQFDRHVFVILHKCNHLRGSFILGCYSVLGHLPGKSRAYFSQISMCKVSWIAIQRKLELVNPGSQIMYIDPP